jgi:hypothetical protein
VRRTARVPPEGHRLLGCMRYAGRRAAFFPSSLPLPARMNHP